MGEIQTFPAYLQGLLDAAQWSRADLARASGVAESRLSRWMKGEVPSIDNARAVADSLKRPLLEVLTYAGLITDAEANAKIVKVDVTHLSDDQLIKELRKRLAAVDTSRTLTADEVAADGDRFVTGKPKKKVRSVQ